MPNLKTALLLSASALILSSAHAAPSGKIGFIGTRGAQIWQMSSGKTRTLPHSTRADTFAFSPRGTAVFWVPPREKPGPAARATPHLAYQSRSPYRVSRPVKALESSDIYSYLWNPGADTLYLSNYQLFGAFSPASGTLKREGFLPESFDASGRKMGYSTETDVIIRDVKTGQERVIFSSKRPKPLFDALRRAKDPKAVVDLLQGETPAKGEVAEWQVAGPALSPDGNRAYFATNAGTGYGAAGNGMQGLFACDLKTGTLSILSRIGPLFGRPPELSVSPDGDSLLAVSSVHASAADNSSVAQLIDLRTQKSRELIYKMPGAKDQANFYGGSAWSPDGKYLALSAYFYDAEAAMHSLDTWDGPKNSEWETVIFAVSNGKIWGTKAGAHAPGWSR